ncbi:Geranylgeranyl transferase type-1 subunit beta [Hondaea fermentalgiana]|uniref:Geranylgeranyl transferase type-1 subunit beta n=1 Tax=Hondaea fermentalgiana TaxID=2315210 RepID=A0A2R5GP77_9STRA|nr:Geranylgeranyl transferase type-1 subunit beta [Hondaea fermentalgiana]|eukprot:GBG32677.1 Geranylgeranyl transferase type-1 subunit beta [Hondaea fermentalgiana]
MEGGDGAAAAAAAAAAAHSAESELVRDDVTREAHIRYFSMFLGLVPKAYTSLDTSRLMMVYFAVNALDMLGALDRLKNRQEIIDWVYMQQVVVVDGQNGPGCGGFLGGGFLGPMGSCSSSNSSNNNNAEDEADGVSKYHQAHVSMTYCALLVLAILGDDYSRVDRAAAVAGLRSLQQPDGSFQAVAMGTENDMRFVFCACAVSFMLQDFSGIDVDKTARFILASQSYDGGFGILPNQETHAGAIYTAVGSLALLGRLDDIDRESLERFLVSRQVQGFNGRINKVPDTCYTFWVGGSMQMLNRVDWIDVESTRAFLLSCQSPIGGFSKHPGKPPEAYPDILHSHYAVTGLSLIAEPGFAAIDCSLGITTRAYSSSSFYNKGGSGPLTGMGTPYRPPTDLQVVTTDA